MLGIAPREVGTQCCRQEIGGQEVRLAQGASEKHVASATNDPGIDVEEYKRRGIETNYRLLESMRAKTGSTGHGPRVTCVAITIVLLNAWVLVGALAKLPGDAACAGRPIRLHSALVAMAVLVWYPDTGPGPPPIAL